MVEDLVFTRVDDNTISYSFTEKVRRDGQVSEQEFKEKYNSLVQEREEIEKQLIELNNKRHEFDNQLNAYEAFMDSEKVNENQEEDSSEEDDFDEED